MRDRLENFIKQNRDQFDREVPNLKVWGNIEKRLDPPKAKRITMRSIMGIAASVIILLGVGALGGQYFFGNGSNGSGIDIPDDPVIAKMELDFQKRINQKRAQLASYNYDISVNDDLKDLDETLAELRKELKNVPKGSEEQIVEAMIKNYETKIKILEIVLDKIDSNNSKKKEDNEGSEM